MTGNGWRILVIEDNPTNLELLMFLLRASGHTPYAAHDGVSGLQRSLELLPDLIICDIQLPSIDGYEVARRIKNHKALRDITLVAVTACAMPADRHRALAAGFDGYISKPITPYTFGDEISRFLPSSPQAMPQFKIAGADTACGDTILVAEHSPVNLPVLSAILDPGGMRYTVARSVSEAIEAISASNVHMLIAELDLPGGGAEALVKSSAGDRASCPTLILVPADADVAPLPGLEQCDVMRWPIDPAKLLRWVESHIPTPACVNMES